MPSIAINGRSGLIEDNSRAAQSPNGGRIFQPRDIPYEELTTRFITENLSHEAIARNIATALFIALPPEEISELIAGYRLVLIEDDSRAAQNPNRGIIFQPRDISHDGRLVPASSQEELLIRTLMTFTREELTSLLAPIFSDILQREISANAANAPALDAPNAERHNLFNIGHFLTQCFQRFCNIFNLSLVVKLVNESIAFFSSKEYSPLKINWKNYSQFKQCIIAQKLKEPVNICLQGKWITVEQEVAEKLKEQKKITEIRINRALERFIEIVLENPNTNKIPDEEHLMCPITYDLFVDPVITKDGVTYEREALLKLKETESDGTIFFKDPMTREPHNWDDLQPNLPVKALADILKKKNKPLIFSRWLSFIKDKMNQFILSIKKVLSKFFHPLTKFFSKT